MSRPSTIIFLNFYNAILKEKSLMKEQVKIKVHTPLLQSFFQQFFFEKNIATCV